MAHAAVIGRPLSDADLTSPWGSVRFATAYAARGPGALRGTAPIGAALTAALNADAGGPWDGGPRMSRLIASEARAAAPALAVTGSDSAIIDWWVHAHAGASPVSGVLTPPWLVERLVAVPVAGAGAPFPLGAALLAIHSGSETYRRAYRLEKSADRVAFVFDLLLHVFDTPTRRLAFNPAAVDWFGAPPAGAPASLTRFELLVATAIGRPMPMNAEEAEALALWYRAQACRAFPQFGAFASLPERDWCSRDRKLELVGLVRSSTGLGQNLAMSAEALRLAGVPLRLRDSEEGFRECSTAKATATPSSLAPLAASGGGTIINPVPAGEPDRPPSVAETPLDPPPTLPGMSSDVFGTPPRPACLIAAEAPSPFAGAPLPCGAQRTLSPSEAAANAFTDNTPIAARFVGEDWGDHLPPSLRPRRKALLLHLNADEAPQVLCNPLFDREDALHTIAFLLWELEAVPRAHRLCLDIVDEIWCPTRYVADIYRPHTDAKVVTVGKGISLPTPQRIDRARFGLPERAFVFLVSFDFHSSVERKNPLAAVRAFRRAFDGAWGDSAVHLVIKTTPPVADHWGDPNGMWPRILAEAEADPRIVLVSEHLPFRVLLGLIESADCLVSPHRAEGFGYMPAYALSLGRPVIATDYSGTRDFVSDATGYPVPWTARAVAPGESILAVEDAFWADVDVDALARAMRRLRDRPLEARSRAAAGQRLMAAEYSMAACAARYRAALAASGVI
ncbi:MAG: glycosyltransferase [Pseudomonadota bacterium]